MKAVIFDLDGTILDTVEDIAGAVNYILGEYEMPLRTVGEVKSFVGNGLGILLRRSVPAGTSDDTIGEMFPKFVSYYKSHASILTRPYDGIQDVIQQLKEKGYALAVASNKRREAVEDLCEEYYKGMFDAAAGDEDGLKIKPEPDMIIKVLDRLGVDKDDVVYIGDSEVDIQTVRNTGIKGIFVSWGFRGRKVLEELGVEMIADEPHELLRMIDEVFGGGEQ